MAMAAYLALDAERSFAHRFRIVLDLPPPQMPYDDGSPGFHLFLSHVWAHAQDQAGTIKHMLRSHYPSLRCFLEVISDTAC